MNIKGDLRLTAAMDDRLCPIKDDRLPVLDRTKAWHVEPNDIEAANPVPRLGAVGLRNRRKVVGSQLSVSNFSANETAPLEVGGVVIEVHPRREKHLLHFT